LARLGHATTSELSLILGVKAVVGVACQGQLLARSGHWSQPFVS
jgi:hypothetical protein